MLQIHPLDLPLPLLAHLLPPPILRSLSIALSPSAIAMGGGNAQKSKTAHERNLEKNKASKGSQLEANKKSMNIQICARPASASVQKNKPSSLPAPTMKNDENQAPETVIEFEYIASEDLKPPYLTPTLKFRR